MRRWAETTLTLNSYMLSGMVGPEFQGTPNPGLGFPVPQFPSTRPCSVNNGMGTCLEDTEDLMYLHCSDPKEI